MLCNCKDLFAQNSYRMFSLLIVLCITHLPMVVLIHIFFYLSGKVLFLIFFKALFQGLIFGGGYIFGGAYLWREISVSKSIGLAL